MKNIHKIGHASIQFIIGVFAIILVGMSGIFLYGKFIQASPFNFVQSSWSGGITGNTAVHPTNQTGWTEYDQNSSVTAGATITLPSVAKTFTDDGTIIIPGGITPTGGGFSNGTLTDTTMSGTLVNAKIKLTPTYLVGSKTDFPFSFLDNSVVFDSVTNSAWVAYKPCTPCGGVSKVDVTTGGKTDYSFGFGNGVGGLAFDNVTNSIWATKPSSNTIKKVNITDGSIVGTYTVGNGPRGVAFDNITNSVWVVNSTDVTVSKVDVTTGSITGTYAVGSSISDIVFDSVTHSVWVTNYDSISDAGTLIKIDIVTGTITGTYAVGAVGSSFMGIAFDGVTNSIWAADYNASNVVKVNINTGAVTGTYPVGLYPWGVSFDSVTNSIWVANQGDSTVSKVNITDGTKVNYTVGSGSTGIAFDSFTNSVWVNNPGSSSISKVAIQDGPFLTPGTFESDLINFGEVSNFTSFSFTKSTPTNTTLTMDVRASVDGITWLPDWTPVLNGGDISAMSGNRYIQYRANFSTTDTAVSATLYDVSISSNYWTFVDDDETSTLGGLVPSGGAFGSGTNTSTVITGSGAGASVGLGVGNTYATGLNPNSSVFDITNNVVWVTNQGDNTITKVDAVTGIGSSIALGATPSAIAFDVTNNAVWIANGLANTVTEINAATGAVIGSPIVVGTYPSAIAFDVTNNVVWVTNFNDNTVTKINAATGVVIGSPIAVGYNPGAIAFDITNNVVWVANYSDNTVTEINAATGVVIGSPIALGSSPAGIAFDVTNNLVWVANRFDNTVIKINAATGVVIGSPIAVGAYPTAIAFDVTNNTVWVANYNHNNVTKINAATGAVVGAPFVVGVNPTAVAFDVTNNAVWVANYTDNTITKLINSGRSYLSSGTFTSNIIDLGAHSNLSTLSYNVNTPTNTTITVDLRASSDNVTWSAWTTDIANGGDISAFSNNRLFQYRVNFATTDATVTSTLNDITLNYSQHQKNGSLASSVYDTGSASNSITKLSWDGAGAVVYNTNPFIKTAYAIGLFTQAEEVRFQVRSSSDGYNWSDWCGSFACDGYDYFYEADNGVNLPVDHPLVVGNNDRYFQYKAFLFSGGYLTPILASATVSYDTGSVAAPAISNVLSSSITSNGATITWTTDTPADSYVNYSTSPSLASPTNVGSPTLTTSHTVVLTGLSPTTPYYFEVLSTDGTSQLTTDTNGGSYYTFTTGVISGGGGSSSIPVDPLVPVVHISASPTTVAVGGTSVITYTVTSATRGCVKSGDWSGMTEGSGTDTVGPLSLGTYTYTLLCSGHQNRSGSGSVTVTSGVTPPPPPPLPVVTISANPTTVAPGKTSVISYTVENVTQGCTKEGDWSGTIDSSGSGTYTTPHLSPGSYTYTLICTGGQNRTGSGSVTVTSAESGPGDTGGDVISGGTGTEGIGGSSTSNGGGGNIGKEKSVVPISENPVTSNSETKIQSALPKETEKIIADTINVTNNVLTKTKKNIIEFSETPTGAVTTTTVTALGAGGGSAIALSSAGGVASFADIPLLALRLWSVLLVSLGLRKKRAPWGTVYDSVTKQPLDPVYVVLKDKEGKEVGTAITDLDGRFGFLVPPGSYQIETKKTNYTSPSQKLAGRNSDELYDNLYFGGEVLFGENTVITKNIPMDPLAFDWNEFAKRDKKLMTFYSRNTRAFSFILNVLFYIGLISVILLFIATPDKLNFALLIIYGVLLALHLLGFKPKTFGTILDATTKEPLSYAIVRVFRKGFPQEIFHRVADQYGHYYCLLAKGEYYVTIDRKNADESYTTVFTSPMIDARKGIINQNFTA
ncbi:MAG: hypothetical protein WC847_00520 [Candidatus Paceibacterota bacterium]|jgi:DNA-binding beta-propeller fold protein YncE